jgi:CHAT domain-containing protein
MDRAIDILLAGLLLCQLLTNVPFAALRDHNQPAGQHYLIERHTISVTPSVRVLKSCGERLKDLQKLSHNPSRGAIVALGDPAYGPNSETPRLEWSGEEVQFIESLFGETQVVKLLGPDATPHNLLKWAKFPSENEVTQAVFHIGAHGKVDFKEFRKGGLLLARPGSKPCGPHKEVEKTCGKLTHF